ncbi:NAD(P)-dependent alcohol dehydrogenase [Rhodotorula paludigena]|uniref:NAD(P)-dependent alcohol dehydrogenase n=1 Tax=Rhodotorula paludigena TaxID=86838 RepID=UPI0031761200
MSAPGLSAATDDVRLPTGDSNVSFVLHGIDDVRYEDRPVPTESSDNDAIVAPKKVTLCGSDVHYYKEGRVGDFIVEKPMVLGHETAALVVKVGRNVTNIKPGDRVALEPGESCRMCPDCKAGHYQRCPKMKFAATPPFDGTLAHYYTLPADLCYKLPDNMTLEEGALLEPMSVGVHAVHKIGQMKLAANVVVFGAGPVGLLTAAVAKGLGARKVVIVDIQEPRLQFAKENNLVHDYYLPSKPNEGEAREDYPRRNAKEIRERFEFEERGPNAVDLIVDCSGAEVCIQTAIYLLGHGGTMVQVGHGKPNITLDYQTVVTHELTIKGSFRYGPGAYRLSMDLVARGAVNLKALISHRYTFRDAVKAFEANHKGVGQDGKPLIKAVIDGPEADEKL